MKGLDKLVSGIKFHLALKKPKSFFIDSATDLKDKIEFHNAANTGNINNWDCIEEIYRTRDFDDLIKVEIELVKQFENDKRFVQVDKKSKLNVDSIYHIYIVLAK